MYFVGEQSSAYVSKALNQGPFLALNDYCNLLVDAHLGLCDFLPKLIGKQDLMVVHFYCDVLDANINLYQKLLLFKREAMKPKIIRKRNLNSSQGRILKN